MVEPNLQIKQVFFCELLGDSALNLG